MNQHAKDIYKGYYRRLVNLMNQHYQIAQNNPQDFALPPLATEIRKVAAVCETWRNVARYNASVKYYQQDV